MLNFVCKFYVQPFKFSHILYVKKSYVIEVIFICYKLVQINFIRKKIFEIYASKV